MWRHKKGKQDWLKNLLRPMPRIERAIALLALARLLKEAGYHYGAETDAHGHRTLWYRHLERWRREQMRRKTA